VIKNNYKPIKNKKMENSKPVTSSKFAIVNAVATALNLGDYGKIEGFVERTAKALKRENETFSRKIKNAEHNFESTNTQLADDLEDAQQAVEDAYKNLDPAKLVNNEMQKAFRATYLASIDTAEGKEKGVEESIKTLKEAHKEEVKKHQDQIDIRTKRIKRLTKGVTK